MSQELPPANLLKSQAAPPTGQQWESGLANKFVCLIQLEENINNST